MARPLAAGPSRRAAWRGPCAMRRWLPRHRVVLLLLLAALLLLTYGLSPQGAPVPTAADAPATPTAVGTVIPDRYNPPPGYQDGLTWPLWPTPPGPLPTDTPLATSAAGASSAAKARVAPLDDPDGSCHDIHCIQHVVVIVMENQSFDRLLGTFHTSSGTPVAGFPTTTGGA